MGVDAQSVDLGRLCSVDDLVTEAGAVNAAAFARLYSAHVDDLVRYARRLAPARVAEDLAAEAFANTWAQMVAGRGPRRRFAAYLRASIWNLHQAHVRREERVIWVADLQDAVAGDTPCTARWEAPSPEQQLLARMLSDRVSEEMAGLPRRWQAVLVAVHAEGLPYKEVSALLEVSEPGARQLARRARLHMRDKLADLSPEDRERLFQGSCDGPVWCVAAST